MYALSRGHEKAPSSRDDAPTPDAAGHRAAQRRTRRAAKLVKGRVPLTNSLTSSAASECDALTVRSLAPSLEARGHLARPASNQPAPPTPSTPPGGPPTPPRAWGRRRGV